MVFMRFECQMHLKLRALNFGEMYFILNKRYGIGINFAFCKVDERYLYIPRYIFEKQTKNHIFLPLCLFNKTYCHYNVLLLNTHTRTMERFDPVDMTKYKYLDTLLHSFCNNNGYKYIYNRYRGPQWMEMMEVDETMNCGFWVLMYLEERIRNINKTQKMFMNNWMKKIGEIGFHKTMCNYKSIVLNEISISINIDYNSLCDKVCDGMTNILDYYIYN
jgi:hypothetical protein